MNSSKEQIPYKFLVFAGLFLVAIFVVENINHRFWLNDFKVYYGAAQALRSGTPVYDTPFSLGSGFYKYSPFTILLVLPLSLFSYETACVIEYFVLAVSIVCLFLAVYHIINKHLFPQESKNKNLILSLAFICVINHLVRELHLGNINMVLLLLLCLSLFSILDKRFLLAGFLFAIVFITKPFFGLLLMPLILRRNIKVILSFGVSVFLFLLNPAVLIGFPKNTALHKEWLHTLLEHNSSFPSNNTIDNLVRLYVNPGLPNSFQFYVLLAVCIGYLIFFLSNRKFENENRENLKLKNANLIVEWFVLIAVMPGLFRTDTNHFLLSLPLIMILVFYLSTIRNYYLVACFILLIFLFEGNSSDLVGKKMSTILNEAGVIGISNLLIIFSVIMVYFNVMRKKLKLAGA